MKKRSRSRREFLGLTGASVAGLASGSFVAAKVLAQTENAEINPRDADLVVFNAKVYTVDPRSPRAEAFAVKGGRFAFVGSSAEARAFIGKGTRTFDSQQMTIVPGFIDCHNHAGGNTLLYDVIVGNPYEVEFVTIASIIEKLRARAQKTPAGFWVDGYFFDDTKVKDNRQLNIHDLDQVSQDHPVCVHHRGGHTSYYNSKALELAGINKHTPNRMGGTYDHDENGELTGRVTDRAREVFIDVGKRETFTEEQKEQRDRDGLAYISKQFVRYGLTSVHHEGGDLFALQQVRARGELLHRVSFETSGEILEAMIKNGISTGFGDEWIRFGATSEHTADGSFSERTMALSKPYAGTNPPYSGNITETQEDLNIWAERVQRAGIQPNCHANGDVAIDMVLKAYERAQQVAPRPDVRPKITHCTLINEDLLRRIKALGAVPAPFTTYAYYNTDKFHFYGEERMKWSMAYRSFLDAGIRAAAGSDFSPGPFAPLMGIQGMVTRTGWNGETWGANQRISLDEALQVNTINGAYNSHEEAIKGSITPGKLADFVVLADDPHTVSADRIKDIAIVQTVTGGMTVYQK
ncbi:MAG TPA: amidohydrolase [Candidatus Acidoferrales bacterium]|nr:amidohydrolase [Candidatus Acidoferrales bacterium]